MAREQGEPLDEEVRRRRLKRDLFQIDEGPVRIGRFELRGRIGEGAMGVVYEADDPQLKRSVAVKVLHPQASGGATRLLREAQTLARLTHPNVVTVHDVGESEYGVHVAMERVHGVTLGAWLDSTRTLLAILDVLRQAVRGLQAAHAVGIVHRDFKPENVIVGDDGRVRVLDFGLALSDGPADTDAGAGAEPPRSPRLTAEGELIGTPAYMAPEQFDGAPPDARSDQFAFCVVAFEALAGRHPFGGDDVPAIRDAARTGRIQAVDPERVPPDLLALLVRGLHPAPARRHPDMASLAAALEAWEQTRGRIRLGRPAALAVAVMLVAAPAWLTLTRDDDGAVAEAAPVAEVATCPDYPVPEGPPEALQKRLSMMLALMDATSRDDPAFGELQLRKGRLLQGLGRSQEACDAFALARSSVDTDVGREASCRYARRCGGSTTSAPAVACAARGPERRGACEGGNADCCDRLAIVAEFGCIEASKGASTERAERACAEAFALYDLACKAGSRRGCESVKQWRAEGKRGVPPGR